MSRSSFDTDVLIVGAGPVGLFLANECARRGLRWRLVETHATQSVHSKALAIFPRTLEIFDMAGVVAPFLESGEPRDSVAVIAHGRALARMRFQPEESPYPFVAMVPQDVTEKLLVRGAAPPGRQRRVRNDVRVGGSQRGDRRQRRRSTAAERGGDPRRRSSSAATARTARCGIS